MPIKKKIYLCERASTNPANSRQRLSGHDKLEALEFLKAAHALIDPLGFTK